MVMRIKEININYTYYGEGENTIVLLHGWGQNIQMMQPIGDRLQNQYKILIIDLPGYGKSEEPKEVWSIEDYAECINHIVRNLRIENPIMVGHSFGGKISLMYASKYKTQKLVLFGSPYCKEIKKLSIKTKVLKTLKKVPGLNKFENIVKKHVGSVDYRHASVMMRKILVETVNLDITENVKKIICPTLLIWGENDEAVPLERAYELEKLIPDAAVIVYDSCTHYAYLEHLGQSISILKTFLGGS